MSSAGSWRSNFWSRNYIARSNASDTSAKSTSWSCVLFAAEAAPEASSAEPLAEEDPEYESYEVFQEKIRRRMDYRGAGGKDDVGKEAGTGNISDPNTTS